MKHSIAKADGGETKPLRYSKRDQGGEQRREEQDVRNHRCERNRMLRRATRNRGKTDRNQNAGSDSARHKDRKRLENLSPIDWERGIHGLGLTRIRSVTAGESECDLE